MSTRIHIVVGDELLEKVDGARGRESRSSFVRWAVEQAMLMRRSYDEVARDVVEKFDPPEHRRAREQALSRADLFRRATQ